MYLIAKKCYKGDLLLVVVMVGDDDKKVLSQVGGPAFKSINVLQFILYRLYWVSMMTKPLCRATQKLDFGWHFLELNVNRI